MPSFSLRDNGFALLATHPRANRAQLEDAYHDAFLDAEDYDTEARLNRAQQYLVSPKDRLESELGFFIDTKPATIKAILAALGTPGAQSSPDLLAGLDRANLLAHLCGEGPAEDRRSAAIALIDAYETIEPDQVHEAINASRAISGFGLVDPGSVKAGLSKLCAKHSAAILDALPLDGHGSDHINSLAKELADCGPNKRSIFEGVLREYEGRVSPELERGTDRIRQLLDEVTQEPDTPGLVDRIGDRLREWDRKAQPLQVADRVRGIDEHHSRHLFEVVRKTCLELANDRGLYQQSLAISEVALEIFAELPDAASKLAEDVGTLRDLVTETEHNERLTPLAHAVEEARSNYLATCHVLRKSGFQGNAANPVGDVHWAFAAIIDSRNSIELNGMAARLVRNLGLDLCNQSNDNEATLALIDGLLRYRPALPEDMLHALENDERTLRRNIEFDAMLVAVKAERWDEGDRLAERLLVDADDESRQVLLNVRATIAERKRGKRMKLIGWSVAAAVVLFVILTEEGKDTRLTEPQYGPAYETPGYETYNTADGKVAVEATTQVSPTEAAMERYASPEPASSSEETPPAPNQPNVTVSLGELRYCKRQKARITAVESDVVSNNQAVRYNVAIDDYNARCGSFNYRKSDMNQVDGEIANDAATLRAEGLEMIGGQE